MKKIITAITFSLIMLAPLLSKAQCKDFTETKVMPKLEDFIISGRYNTINLYDGEEILIFKTLSKGITYRIVVMGDENLPANMEMKIENWDGENLYQAHNKSNTHVWDYNCDKTQRIKIIVKVPERAAGAQPQKGCVSIIAGIKAG